jgi:hypothetical protein
LHMLLRRVRVFCVVDTWAEIEWWLDKEGLKGVNVVLP